MIHTAKELEAMLGTPEEAKADIVKLTLPFPMRLSWDKKTVITTVRCHEAVASSLKAALEEILFHYGFGIIRELGMDLFGGIYNVRKTRGGNDFSSHSWGVSIDLDPERNRLKETSRTARFARPEYSHMIDIFEQNGFTSMGRERNYDWMHFQFTNF